MLASLAAENVDVLSIYASCSPRPGDMLLRPGGPILEILSWSLSRGEKSGKGEWSVSRTGGKIELSVRFELSSVHG